MISFSNLFEAVVQQPTPPQQPVQQTGAQIPQQSQPQPIQKQPIQFDQQQPVQQSQLQKSTGIINKIKTGYKKINDKYEAGKEIGMGLLPIAASLAMPIGMYGSMFVSNPAVANAMRSVGVASMVARPVLGAMRQAKMVTQQGQQPVR